jgi:predicted Zn-dependent protease
MVKALKVLDTWLYFEPDNMHAYFLRGELHRNVGAVNRARDEYRRVVELEPGHDKARRHLAWCLVQVGRYEEAAEHLDKLLQKTPGDPHLRTLLARSRYDLGQRGEAIRLLDDVLANHPDYGPALRERGRFALADERYTDAETWFRHALRVLPHSYEASWGLHLALQGQEKTAEAKKQLAHAQQLKNTMARIHEIQTHQMTLRPTDAALHAEFGELLLQMGQSDNGERWLLSAVKLNPGMPAPHRALARHYEERGDAPRAAHHRREAERASLSPKR